MIVTAGLLGSYLITFYKIFLDSYTDWNNKCAYTTYLICIMDLFFTLAIYPHPYLFVTHLIIMNASGLNNGH